MLGTVLVVLLVLMLLGALPTWPHSRNWGYGPPGRNWVFFWPSWSSCCCWVGFDMNTRTIARDWAEEAPHSLSERIARFAMAINACSAQNVSKSYWKQAKRELASESDTDPNESCFRISVRLRTLAPRCPAQPDTMCPSRARDFKPGDAYNLQFWLARVFNCLARKRCIRSTARSNRSRFTFAHWVWRKRPCFCRRRGNSRPAGTLLPSR